MPGWTQHNILVVKCCYGGEKFFLLMLSKKERPFLFVFKMKQASYESSPYITWQKLGLCSLAIF